MNTITLLNNCFKKHSKNAKYILNIDKNKRLIFTNIGNNSQSQIISIDNDNNFIKCLNNFMTAGDIAHTLNITIRKAERILHHNEKYQSKMPSVYHRFELHNIQDNINTHWFKYHNKWVKRHNCNFGKYKGITVISKDTFKLFEQIFESRYKKLQSPLDKKLFNSYKYLNKKELLSKLLTRTRKLILLSSISHHFLGKKMFSNLKNISYDYLFDHYRDCMLPKHINYMENNMYKSDRYTLNHFDPLMKRKHLSRQHVGILIQSIANRKEIIKNYQFRIKQFKTKLAINKKLYKLEQSDRQFNISILDKLYKKYY